MLSIRAHSDRHKLKHAMCIFRLRDLGTKHEKCNRIRRACSVIIRQGNYGRVKKNKNNVEWLVKGEPAAAVPLGGSWAMRRVTSGASKAQTGGPYQRDRQSRAYKPT